MNATSTAERLPARLVPLRRGLHVALLLTALVYVPLAVNYMWWAFTGDAPRWQEAITAAVNGGDYAYREGSVESVREVDYTDHRWVMLVHTVLGGIALLLATTQLSSRMRRRSMVRHRWVGRVYLALMTISMVTALAFLIGAGPVDRNLGNGFYLQLWGLALGTLITGFLALAAIRQKNVLAHQAWIFLNFSLMMTAPLLRVAWIFLAPLFPDQELLDNLGMGSGMLGVLAPGGAAIAVQLALRSRHERHGNDTAVPLVRYGVPTAVAVVGLALLVVRFRQVDDVVPGGMLWLPWATILFYIGICLAGGLVARHEGFGFIEQRWRILVWGAALAPYGAVALDLATAIGWGAPAGVLAGLMVGTAGPVIVSYAMVVHRFAGFVVRREHHLPKVPEPVA